MRERKEELIYYFQKVFCGMPKRVGLVGLGKTNRALLPLLSEIDGISITLRDSGKSSPSPLTEEADRVFLGDSYLSGIDEDILFLSPSVRRDTKALLEATGRGVILSSDCEVFFSKERKELILGVTGSDGKSTVTELTSRLLQESGINAEAIGNIGIPYASRRESDAYAIELSSFNLEYLTPKTDRAAITSITPNHLNWHKSYGEYIEAKRRILSGTKEAVLSLDCDVTERFAMESTPFAVFSTVKDRGDMMRNYKAEHYYSLSEGFIFEDDKKIISKASLLRHEEYNVRNVMAALALTYGHRSKSGTESVLRSFGGLPHRCELISSGEVAAYDSSIDTTPERCAQTLNALGKRVRILLGGRGKGLSLDPITEPLKRYADKIAVYGDERDRILEHLARHEGLKDIPRGGFLHFDDAVKYLFEGIKRGECVLLSPACTAYGEFSDFEERGRRFKELIWKLNK